MTILTIDIGNTKTKVAIFKDNLILQHNVFKQIKEEDFIKITKSHSIDKVVLSSVNKDEEKRVDDLLEKLDLKYYTLSHISPLPFKIDYETPNTLGHDRIAAIIGAYSLKGKGDFLIIDIGTCITYDLVINNHFIGGNIAPGLQMRLDALHDYTASLPQLEIEIPKNELGLSTNQAMLNGVYWGVSHEIKSIISRYNKIYDKLNVIITGGGAKYFEKEPNITYEPMLVSFGLNFLANNLSK